MHRRITIALALAMFVACQTPEEEPADILTEEIDQVNLTSNLVETQTAFFFKNLFDTNGGGWTGGDGAYSIPLPDGRILWTFGDSFLGTVNPDYSRSGPLVNNLFVIQDGDELTTLQGGTEQNPEAYVRPFGNPDHYYWPGDGLVLGNRVYIFMQRIRPTGQAGVFSFEHIGTDMAVFSLPDLQLVDQIKISRSLDILTGVSVFRENDFIYIYSSRTTFGKNALLSRISVDDLSEVQYWNGSAWATELVETAYLLKGNGQALSVSNQFKAFKQDGSYRLLVQDDFFGSNVKVYQSDNPAGPWGNPVAVYDTPETGADGGNIFTYNAFAHPHIIHPEKGMLMTYSVNSFNFGSLFQDARLYRPRYVWVKQAGG